MPEPKVLAELRLVLDPQIREAAPGEVFVPPDRQRKLFKPDELKELTKSISEEGQHTPGLCFVNEAGVHQLIFGERRLKACATLGMPFRYQLAKSLPNDYVLAVIEFSENINRSELHWRERSDTIAELHALMQEHYGIAKPGPGAGGHSLRDTATYLNQSVGTVATDIEISEFAAVVPEVAAAKSRSDATKLIEKLKQEVKREVMLDKARAKAEESRQEFIVTPEGAPTTMNDLEAKIAYYDERILLGRMEDLLGSLPSPHVVLFDPPWGVDFDKVKAENPSQGTYTDSSDAYANLLPEWLKLLYDHMLPNSHLYMFFGITQHSFVYDTLEAAGFACNRIPLLWHKAGAHRTRNPERWPGRCYEPIAFAHKGSRALVRRGQPDIITTPAPTPTMKGSHPSAKHPEIYRDLLLRSCEPGNTVLDPMCGSGMFAVAAESLSRELALDWRMIELQSEFRDLAIFNAARGYAALVGEAPDSGLPTDFRDITPGTTEWQTYWNAHPELQSDMLAWIEKA